MSKTTQMLEIGKKKQDEGLFFPCATYSLDLDLVLPSNLVTPQWVVPLETVG